ncbi:uncharacterized protein Pyn_04651 [Prunus yedoensis var. nudiflora]|uniref:Uncharacterized protein n=1 Tax=Prunus yedoensis var. nudiflora TaxID=2094558 RepID=A0A314XPZ1_PRUYE|nr:uncharacterized protein Pyn_04651 [Prunus yedoensis var. nudiflora]
MSFFFLLRQAYALYLVSSTIEADLLIFISSLSSSPLLPWTPPTLKFPLILASLRLHSPSFALFYCLYRFRAPNFAASGRSIRFVFELTEIMKDGDFVSEKRTCALKSDIVD